MIDDLSKTLRALLTQNGLPPEVASAQVTFDHPEENFSPQQTTINLFLYDIREDLELRNNEPIIEQKNGDVVTHRPPLRIACSYLVTAWPIGGADLALQEQRLLSHVLRIFAQFPQIPSQFLQGSLKRQKSPLPFVTALVDPQKNLSEFWTALGTKLRPSVTVTATIAMDVFEPKLDSMVVADILRLGQGSQAPSKEKEPLPGEEDLFRIAGRVTNGRHEPVEGALVKITQLGLRTRTNADGRYVFARIKPGNHKMQVVKGGQKRDVEIQVGLPRDSIRKDEYDVQLSESGSSG